MDRISRRSKLLKGFQTFAHVPDCIGTTIDGEYIWTKHPPNSESMYKTYEQYYPRVLFAMSDTNYCLTYIHVRSYGKSSDAGIFLNIKKFINGYVSVH